MNKELRNKILHDFKHLATMFRMQQEQLDRLYEDIKELLNGKEEDNEGVN